MGFIGVGVGKIRFEFRMGWVGLEFCLGFDWFGVEPIKLVWVTLEPGSVALGWVGIGVS